MLNCELLLRKEKFPNKILSAKENLKSADRTGFN